MVRKKKETIPLDIDNICEEINDIQEELKNIKTSNVDHKNEIVSQIKYSGVRNKIILNKLVDRVIKMYPGLKKDKSKIISKILTNTDDEKDKNHYQECDDYTRININDKIYYRNSKKKIVVDNDLNLVGVCLQKNNIYRYILFY